MGDVSPAVSQIINAVGIKTPQIIEFVTKKLGEFQNITQSTIDQIVDQINKIRAAEVENQENITDDHITKPVQIPIKKITKSKRSCYMVEAHEKPSQNLSPYTIFVKYMHALLISTNQFLSFSQRAVLISNVWAMMSEKDREPFQYAANKANSIS